MLKAILLKRGLRSDRFLTRPFLKLPFLRSFIVALDAYALLQSQYWPSEDIRALQLERIRDILIHAKKKIPFWRDKLAVVKIRPEVSFDWDDFLRIPITHKTDFKDKPVAYRSRSFCPRSYHQHDFGIHGRADGFLSRPLL